MPSANDDDTASTAPLVSPSHESLVGAYAEGSNIGTHAPTSSGPEPAARGPDKAKQQQLPKDPPPCACKHDARNLVVCIDGTANQFSEKNTNVVELYSRLIKDDDQQLTYYNSGIGTYARETKTFKYWRQAIDHTVDMAIAWNFKKIVLDAYQWLSENYKPGDRIFLFGFSRGAYQVRVIAAMIEMVGLLHKGNNGQIEFAYELYMATTALLRRISGLPPAPRDPEVNQNTSDVNTKVDANRSITSWFRRKILRKPSVIPDPAPRQQEPEAPPLAVLQRDEPDHGRTSKSSKPVKSREGKGKGKADPLELSDRFKRTLCRPNVKVHFVGAWDTVSSIGVARGPSLPETTMGMKHVCVFRHALALDEVRVKFLPEYANGGAGPRTSGDDKNSDARGNVKEVWFAGSHSDIGGGSTLNINLDRFGPALRWMTYEALREGLRMTDFRGDWYQLEPTDSMKWFWRIFEYLPFKRLSYDPTKHNEHTCYRPHRSAPRQIMDGQLIHESVLQPPPDREVSTMLESRNLSKRSARLPPELSWDDIIAGQRVERDPFMATEKLVKDVLGGKLSEHDRHVLITQSSSGVGKQSIKDYADATELLNAMEALNFAAADEQEQRNGRIIDFLIVLRAFEDLNDVDNVWLFRNAEEAWMRTAIGQLSTVQPTILQPALDELKQLFRARTAKLLHHLMHGPRWSHAGRLLDTVMEADIGKSTVTDVADASALLKGLEVVLVNTDSEYRATRITGLLIVLASLPTLPGGTEQYWESKLAELLLIVDWHRPVAHLAMDRIIRPFCDRAPKIVEDLVKRQLSAKERGVLDALLYTESGRQSIASCNQVPQFLNTLKLVLNDDTMVLDLRRSRITDLVVALCAASSFSPSEALPERLFIAALSHVDAARLVFTKTKDQIMQDLCDTAGNVLVNLVDTGLSKTDRAVLTGLPASDFGKLKRSTVVIVSRLLESLEGQPGGNVNLERELRQARVTGIILLLGTFSSLPIGARQYRERILKELLSCVDQEQSGTREAVDRIMKIFVGRLQKVIRASDMFRPVVSVSFSPNGARIASAGHALDGIRIWNAETGKEILMPLLGHADYVNSVAFSPDGKRLASGSYDRTVRLWDVETGQQIGEPLRGHTGSVNSVAFSPDGRRIVSGSGDGTLRLWDAQTGQAIGDPLRGHDVTSVAFSPAGDRIASGSDNHTIRLWDAGTGKPVGDPFRGHDDWVRSVAYSPDGARIVSGSDDRTIRIWDVQTRKTVLEPLQGHTGWVRSVAFSPDGKYIVSGSDDGTIRIWDAQTGQTVVGPLEAHDGRVWSVAYSPDGKNVLSSGDDGLVKVWDAEVL